MRTGRTHARVPVHQQADALSDLSVLVNAMLDRIDAVVSGMRGALDNVAHDLRTPMARLRGIAETALQSDDPVTLREALADCLEESERIVAMLNTLMDISEAETGTMALRPEPGSLQALVTQAVDLYEDVAEQRGIELSANVPDDLSVVVDRSRMRQVLANLIDNAVKYTASGGRVELTASADPGGWTMLAVEGTGSRIEEAATMRSDYLKIGPASTGGGVTGRRAAFGMALLLAGSVFGWTANGLGSEEITAASPANPPVVERLDDGTAASYADIVDRVAPAVVTIRSERLVSLTSQRLPDHSFFRDFFGDRLPDPRRMPERRQGGMGSGVIVRQDGYILTNHHVVDGAEEVTVELSDGRSSKAKVVGTDAPSDLAVLKIEGTNLQTLALGDSDQVRVGDVVLAVGNPLGVGQTVTMGIVSAKGRSTGGSGDGSFEDFIQTDAPINRGNSGGALVNTEGELIGINSQILSPSGVNIGIGFSIPANMARNVMTQLIEHGDVITAVNGAPVKDSNVLRNEIAELQPGTEAKLTVIREGKEQVFTAKLGELPSGNQRAPGDRGSEGSGSFGMSLEPLTAQRARELGVEARTGVVIAGVAPGSRAAEAGLRPGDVIELVDRQAVTSVEQLRDALAAGSGPALLLVHRGEATVFVTLDRAG
jgi:S1-C subfamily serine protease